MRFINKVKSVKFFKKQEMNEFTIDLVRVYLHYEFSYSDIKKRFAFADHDMHEFLLHYCIPQSSARLLSVLSHSQCLDLYLEFMHWQQAVKKILVSQLSYPALLFVLSLILVFFQKFIVLPQFWPLAFDFPAITTDLNILSLAMNGMIALYVLIFLFILLLGIYLLRPYRRIVLFHLLKDKNWLIMAKLHLSFALSLHLEFLEAGGIQTRESMNILRQGCLSGFTRWLCYHIQDSLDQGESFIQAINLRELDQDCVHLIALGIQTNQLQAMCARYRHLAAEKMKIQLNKFCRLIRLSVYIILVLCIFLMFQCISIPMQLYS